MAAPKPYIDPIEAQVAEESRLFRERLPILLQTALAGRYVVLKHGAIQSDHATLKEAYGAAVQAFGVRGGFALHKVEEERLLMMSPRYSYLR